MTRVEPNPPMAPETLRATLGDELFALVGSLTARIRDLEPITALAGRNSNRASFRIVLDDGSTIKARRLDSQFEAERLARLVSSLRLPCLPMIIARQGAAVIEPWIDGRPLDGLSPEHARLRACGRILGEIHASLPPADASDQMAIAREERSTRIERNMRALRIIGAIDHDTERQIAELVRARPEAPAIGFIHGDFCAANLVETADGRIAVIDNETLRFEALDYDLARTWYRWPMNAAGAEAFLEGYATLRDPTDFLGAFVYWAACALVDAAVFRQRAGTGDTDLPLRRLRTLLAEPRSGWSAVP